LEENVSKSVPDIKEKVLWYLPLEPLDKRYTVQTRRLFYEGFSRYFDVRVVDGEVLTVEIEGVLKNVGFLDAYGTVHWKAQQLKKLAWLFREGRIKDGDFMFVEDEEFPLEWIRYMERMSRFGKLNLFAFCHAGTWIETDEISVRMGDILPPVEEGWLKMLDGIFVGSEFHRQEILKRYSGLVDKIFVTGLPFDAKSIIEKVGIVDWKSKENNILFTGRLHPEKQPELFDRLIEILKEEGYNVVGIKTLEKNLTKEEYYKLLSRSKVMVSFALQENFGFSFREALTLNCVSIVPNRLAYVEYVPKELRYDTFDECVRKVKYYLDLPELNVDYSQLFIEDKSVDKMAKVMLR
jgi:glycosyltransferase involved in cell wall biosynthesis